MSNPILPVEYDTDTDLIKISGAPITGIAPQAVAQTVQGWNGYTHLVLIGGMAGYALATLTDAQASELPGAAAYLADYDPLCDMVGF